MVATTCTPSFRSSRGTIPHFAGEVEIAEDVDADGADAGGGAGPNELEQGFASRAIAVALGAAEALGMDRQDGDSFDGAYLAGTRLRHRRR